MYIPDPNSLHKNLLFVGCKQLYATIAHGVIKAFSLPGPDIGPAQNVFGVNLGQKGMHPRPFVVVAVDAAFTVEQTNITTVMNLKTLSQDLLYKYILTQYCKNCFHF